MMANQKIGIIILGLFIIIFALLNTITAGIGIFLYLTNPSENLSLGLISLRIGYAIILFALGVGILKLQLWARLTTVIMASIFLIFDCIRIILAILSQQLTNKSIFAFFSLCINLIILYFLNKPKIKEQFIRRK